MELKVLLSIFSTIVWGLFGHVVCDTQAPPVPEQKPKVEVAAFPPGIQPHKLTIPSFMASVPAQHFAGVSSPCKTLSEARQSAIDDVARQILSSVNIQYDLQYLDRVSGSVRNPSRVVDDRLSKVAKGVVLGVERGIVKSSWSLDASGRHVYFILVRYPDKLIAEMRRLSKGAKVIGRVIRSENGEIELCLTEVNGVSVVLSSVDITVRKVNRFAGFISYYIMKVSEGSQAHYTKAISPVRICAESRNIRLDLSQKEKRVCDYLLGAEIEAVAVLKGHDEIGRVVTAKVDF